MDEKQSDIWLIPLILIIFRGYYDSITFVVADNIFSALVTGTIRICKLQGFINSKVRTIQ